MKKRLFASVGLSLLALNVFSSAAHATGNTEELQSEFTQDQVNSDVGIRFASGPLAFEEATALSFPSYVVPKWDGGLPIYAGSHKVTVMDIRGGRKGWSLGASLSPIIGDDGNELRGATLNFFAAKVEKPSMSDGNNPPVVPKKVIHLQQGGDFETFMVARKGTGAGRTNLLLTDKAADYKLGTGALVNSGITLAVVAGSMEAQRYKGQVYWMLTNAPA